MKADTVKLILALGIALLLGFVCEIIAPETDGCNWISLATSFVSVASMLVPAMGLKYQNAKRGVSIKVFAWIMVVVLFAVNAIFACFDYKIDVYIVIVLLLALIGWGVIYGLLSAKDAA